MSPSYLPGKQKIPGGIYYKGVLVAIRDKTHNPNEGNIELAKSYIDDIVGKSIVPSLLAKNQAISRTAQRISNFPDDIAEKARRTKSLKFLESTRLEGRLEFAIYQILERKYEIKGITLGKEGKEAQRAHLRVPEESIKMPANRHFSYRTRTPANGFD